MSKYTEETLRKVLAQMQEDGEVDCYTKFDKDDVACNSCDFKAICKADTAATLTAAAKNNTVNTKEEKKMAEETLVRADFEEMEEEELLETAEELEIEAVYTVKGKKKKLDKEATIDAIMEALEELDDEDLEGDEDEDSDDSEGEDDSDEDDEEDEESDDDEDSDDSEEDNLTREDLEDMEDEDLLEVAEELEIEPKYTGKGKKKKLDRESLIEEILSLDDEDGEDSEDSDEGDSDEEEEQPKKPAKGKDKEKPKDKPKRQAPQRNTEGPSIESIIVEELKEGGTVNEITDRVEPKLEEAGLECKDVKMRVRRSTHYAGKLEGFEMYKDDTRGRGNTFYQLIEEGKKPTPPKEDKKGKTKGKTKATAK